MIAVIKYNAGNIRSVMNALHRLGASAVLSDDPELVLRADKVILPGVGEAASAMRYLQERGLDDALRRVTRPFLGICLGLQLMCAHSEEGDTPCLGIFPNHVRRFPATGKVPHIGWNNLEAMRGPLFDGLPKGSDVYFVHSYCALPGIDTVATCDYLMSISAAMQRDHFYAVQFHPEKSAGSGERILQNFLAL
ncbi:MAG: imidazole glycerol phosphate synthase subunit HisH [Saprospiraceae bacterium]|nr:imidazole glycerol phosphate synthase subunit HisH [Saprospiraceae bacterium]